MISFNKRLRTLLSETRSNLCVGLDISPEGFGDPLSNLNTLIDHSKRVIDATWDEAIAYKPNLGFFERHGSKGFTWLEDIIELIGKDKIIIGDAKRGDIGNTAKQYAISLFDHFNFDAVTVNPYMGEESIIPFTNDPSKGVFVLCRTSNQGALEIQGGKDGVPVYLKVVEMVKRLNIDGNIGLVVGATGPDEMKTIRDAAPELPFLIPGIGAQGGDIEASMKFGNAGGGALINVSRAIIFSGDLSFGAIKEAAKKFNSEMRNYL